MRTMVLDRRGGEVERAWRTEDLHGCRTVGHYIARPYGS
jgi:hypothetical protein